MIGYLKGKILNENSKGVLLLVGGVGYKVECPRMVSKIDKDEEVELYIYTHVREDSLRLFGFNTESELNLFEELLSVSGVGPKVALGIVASNEISDIISDIVTGGIVNYKISGVGKKTLEKIVIDLKTKMSKIDLGENFNGKQIGRKNVGNDNISQANLALQSLGYKNTEIENILNGIDGIENLSLNEIIKVALKRR
jgi:Holliday junction DNA helicase RuvA